MTAVNEPTSAQAGAAQRRRTVLVRVAHEVRPFRRHIVGVAALELLSTPLLLLTPIPLKIAVDSVLGDQGVPGYIDAILPGWLASTDARLLMFAAALQVLIVVIAELREVSVYVLRTSAGERMTTQFRARLFRHVQRLSLAFHDRRGTADSIYRIQWDAPSIQWITLYGFISICSALITLAAMAVVVVRIDTQLALVSLAVIPPLYLVIRQYNARMRPRYHDMKEADSDALEVVQEVLTAFRVVKAFGREDLEERRFVEKSREQVRRKVRLSFQEGLFGLLVNTATAVGTGAVLLLGVRGVQSERLSLGEFLVVTTYLAQLYGPLKVISKELADMQSSLASVERAMELLDEAPDVVDPPHGRQLSSARGDIEFRDVSFAYESKPVFEHLTFVVAAGTSLGIAGPTGVGKTTLVSLLPRLFDVTAGAVLIDGVDIRDYRLADLRNQFSIVLQDSVLFSTSIAENIRYGRPDASIADVIRAAEAANIHDVVAAFDDGYDTVVGERGMRLSGGERQRVGLARAFVRDAPILILDEPTSALDTATEHSVVEAMQRLMGGRTTLLIAHRTSTLQHCDQLLTLEPVS